MALHKEEKAKISADFKLSELDTGSTHVQVALLTERIKQLTEHFKVHKQDFHGRRGLLKLVNQRRKLLDYLKSRKPDQYKELISRLKLRK